MSDMRAFRDFKERKMTKRLLLSCACVFLVFNGVSHAADTAFKHAGTAVDAGSGQNPTAAGGTLAQNDAIAIGVFWKTNVTITSMTGCGGTWAQSPAGRVARPVDGYADIWAAGGLNAGACTITVNFSGTPTAGSTYIYPVAYTGVATTSFWDTVFCSGTATGTVTNVPCSASLTPNISSGALIGFSASSDTNGLAGTNFTSRIATAASAVIIQDRLFTSALGCNHSRRKLQCEYWR